MAMFIACPSCGKNLVAGLLEPCPQCGWQANPEEKESIIRENAMQAAHLVGRIQGRLIRAWAFAVTSLVINVILVGVLIYVLTR